LLAHNLSKPILTAANAAMQIAGGDLSARVPGKHKTRELHELSRSLNHLAMALENGERWQKQLTSDVAHELRTPLTALQGNIEAMIDGVWQPTLEHLTSCHEETVWLGKLVEDLGQLSILEQKNLELSRTDFDLQKLLANLIEQFTPEVVDKGVVIELSAEQSPLFADYDRLKQVFVNLFSNAVKYTDKGKIDVRVESGNKQYVISIADTGIGIPKDEVPHIFERFYRSDKSRNRLTGGAGIGLTITWAIVAAHGGSIEVESESGRSSVFKVLLPK
jgi:signal transduction histidine kinase